MFPNSDHHPAALAQRTIHAAIPRPVTFDLGFPKRGAGLGPGGVFGAPVPEAAINKHGKALLGENEVRLARQFGAPAPARDAVCPENLNQPQLGALVARTPDAGHHLGSLLLGEGVWHLPSCCGAEPVKFLGQ